MKFSDLLKEHQALKVLEKKDDGICSSEFWDAHEAFRIRLRESLKDEDFIVDLHSRDLRRFISWCSTFRPYEPHTILAMLSD